MTDRRLLGIRFKELELQANTARWEKVCRTEPWDAGAVAQTSRMQNWISKVRVRLGLDPLSW